MFFVGHHELSPHVSSLRSCLSQPTFHLFSPLSALVFSQIDAHEDDVNAVAFADSSSQLLFSGSDDALCKVWDRRTLREDRPQPVGHLAGHRDGITFIHSKVMPHAHRTWLGQRSRKRWWRIFDKSVTRCILRCILSQVTF